MASRTESNNRYLHSYQSKGTHWGAGELYAEAYDILLGFPAGSDGKDSASYVGDLGLSLRLERSCGAGKDYPLQYSCLENFMDRGAWWATVDGVAKSWTRLSE